MRLVGLTAVAVRIFMYGESCSVGFLRNDQFRLGYRLPIILLWGFFRKSKVHWNGRWWFHKGPKILRKLSKADAESFGWQVEMLRRRVGVGW